MNQATNTAILGNVPPRLEIKRISHKNEKSLTILSDQNLIT